MDWTIGLHVCWHRCCSTVHTGASSSSIIKCIADPHWSLQDVGAWHVLSECMALMTLIVGSWPWMTSGSWCPPCCCSNHHDNTVTPCQYWKFVYLPAFHEVEEITGRPARSVAIPVLFLLSGPKIGFSPAGATRCPDKSETWHGGLKVRSPAPNFTFIGAEMLEHSPQTVKISNFGHKFASQGSLVCTVLRNPHILYASLGGF